MKFNISFIEIFQEILNEHYNDKYNSRKVKEIEYFKAILYVLQNHMCWSHYKGQINYRVLNNKHNEYIKKGFYDKLYELVLNKYLKKVGVSVFKYQSTDTSFIFNKHCKGLKRNKYYKSKRGIKISTINDANGIPLSIFCENGNEYDSNVFHNTYNKMLVNTHPEKYTKSNKHKQYFLADAGYDSSAIRESLSDKGYYVIIPQNKRNIKDEKKIIHMTIKEKEIYKKRIVVENYFSWIKNIPKLLCVMEKSINAFEKLVKIISSLIIWNRFLS